MPTERIHEAKRSKGGAFKKRSARDMSPNAIARVLGTTK
jgi:hypothetical protein